MAHKTHDLVVVTREYTDNQGNTKKNYQNVGALMMGDNGPYVILERWFNPAGIANPDNRSNLIVSAFEPRNNQQQGGGQQQNRNDSQSGGYGSQQGRGMPNDGFSDEIPFLPCVLL